MAQSKSTGRSKRWKWLLVCLGLVLLLAGLWRWNIYRVSSPFYGRWKLLDSEGKDTGMPIAEFRANGRAILPWLGPDYPVMNHDVRWRVDSGTLIVDSWIDPPSITEFQTAYIYWLNRIRTGDRDEEHLEIIEVSPEKIRLRLKARRRDPGGPESVYVRIDEPAA